MFLGHVVSKGFHFFVSIVVDASFSENFYGLKRVSLKSTRAASVQLQDQDHLGASEQTDKATSATQHLSESQHFKSLFFLASCDTVTGAFAKCGGSHYYSGITNVCFTYMVGHALAPDRVRLDRFVSRMKRCGYFLWYPIREEYDNRNGCSLLRAVMINPQSCF